MSEEKNYDAIIIGSGQGGTPLAMLLAGKGYRTALIESRNPGGTCVNYGCTPTKTMVASADAAWAVRRATDYGVQRGPEAVRVDMEKIRKRKRDIVDMFRSGSEKALEDTEGLHFIRGKARFTGNHTLLVDDDKGSEQCRCTAPKIFIDTGTSPAVPPIEGLRDIDYLDNESIMELGKLPEHLIVLGGGYVGLEFGQMFRRFGAEVTIVQRNEQLLPREDRDTADAVAELLREEGITLHLKTNAVSAAKEKGKILLTVETADSAGRESNRGTEELRGSHLLVATGRKPNTEDLHPDTAGIETDSRGHILTNERLETNVEGIYAIGDVKGGAAFTHISYDDFRVIRRNLFGDGEGSVAGRIVPYTVFIDPQLGRVGLSEKEAEEKGLSYRVARLSMSSVARALETDDTRGFMKALVEEGTDRIIGFTMLGIQGGEIAAAVQIAMLAKVPYTLLREAPFAHPTIMESLNNLFSGLE